MKFEDRSHEETERQQRCAPSKAWNLAKNMYKLKEKDRATFFSPTKKVLPSASSRESCQREFVVDSGASMHMLSKKDLDSAELETMRTSRSPTTVMTASGEVQTREEATVARGRVPNLAVNRRRRTREGPRTCVCANTSDPRVAHAGEEGRENVPPWYRPVGVAKTSVRRARRENRAARKGKWSPRGTGTTVLTYPCPTASRVAVAVRECA